MISLSVKYFCGFAVIPSSDEIHAPADGTISMIFDTKHAFTIETANGAELLVHMGLDTVRLNGAPFNIIVNVGDTVKIGDKIGTMNRSEIENAGYKIVTPVVVGNADEFGAITLNKTGDCHAGDSIVNLK